MKKIRKGFTLVEVICVLTIIAIIAAIAVPNISGYIEKSKINNCRSIMTDFVNDLEYKIVSKRYYDVNELNDALENCIKESGGETTPENVQSGDEFKIKGICPNGGEYTLSWTITPGKPDENSKIYTAEVKVSNCVCECVGTGENSVVHTGHDFTAALVASEYIDSGKTPEQKYDEIIDEITNEVGGYFKPNEEGNTKYEDPSSVDEVFKEINKNDSIYKVAGLTINEKKEIEWISVYYHDTFSTEESKYKFLTKSKGKLIVKDLTEAEFNDKSKWPPAEGTCGSAVFKKDWNEDINYFVGGINYADTNNVKIGWIQRDGNWYVQSNSEVDGIDINVSSKETDDFQHIISENMVDTSKGLAVSPREPIVAETNLANSFSVSPAYTGTKGKPSFGHIEYSSESKYIKNGYIITDMDTITSGKTWAGVFSGTNLADRTNLEEILKNESTLINNFQNGDKDSLVIAYQEYYKSYDAVNNSYTYIPFTVYAKIEKTTEGSFKDTDIEYTKSDTEKFEIDYLKVSVNENVNVKLPTGKVEALACIKGREVNHITDSSAEGYFFVPAGQSGVYPEGGDQSIIDKLNSGSYSVDIWYQNPATEIIYKVGTVSTTKKSITLDYNAGTNDSSFDINKLDIKGEFDLKIQKSGSTDFLSDTGVVKTDVKHITSNEVGNGFFISDSENINETAEKEIIDKLNKSVGKGNIYYYDSVSKTSEIIGSLSSDFSLSAEYNNAVDKVFRLEGLTVNANYTISIKDSTMTKASVKHSEKLEHFSENSGYLISTNSDHVGKITSQNDSDTLNALKNAYKGDIYIDYTDVNTKNTKVTVDTQAVITAPDYVFYTLSESDNTRYVYLDKYIGNSDTMDVPREIRGYWQMNVKPDNSNPFVEVSYDNNTLYYIDDGKTSVIKQIGKTDVLPPQIDYKKRILYNNNSVKSVTLENCDADTITSYAFLNGGNIEYLNIGTKVKTIGEGAFQGCNSLNNVLEFTIPESVKSIGKNAFNNFVMDHGTMYVLGCTNLVIPESTSQSSGTGNIVGAVTINGIDYEAVIEKGVFNDVHVNSLVIGGNVEKIGEDAFQGINFNKIDNKASLTITGNVETIGASAFKGAGFSSGLVIGDKVKYIKASAFEGCNTYSGTLDLKNVVEIGQNAFKGCTNITGGLVIPETVEFIGQKAFDSFASAYDFNDNRNIDNKIGELVIKGGSSNKGQTLGGLIFTNAKFHNVKIEGKIKEISGYAFKNLSTYNNIKGTLTLSDEIALIGEGAFEDCTGFKGDLDLPNGLTVISDSAFKGCFNFTGDLTIPSTVTEIGSRAFMNCSGFSGKLELNSGLNRIGIEAFAYCKNFQGGLTIPVSVTNGIGDLAFREFAGDTSSPGILELESGSYDGGKSIGPFIFTGAKFSGLTIGGIVENIGSHAFHHGGQLTSDNSVTADYSKITGSIKLQDKVTTVENNAFYGCTGLDGTISMPEVTSIGAQAFENCENLKGNLALVKVSEIGSDAFKGCKSLDGNLTMSAVTKIGSKAFYDCVKLHGDVMIPNTVSEIGHDAFRNFASKAENTGTLTILGGSSAEGTKLRGQIFIGAKFSGLYIGGKIKEIEDYAFYDSKYSNSNFESAYIEYLSTIDHDTVTPENYYSSFSGNITIGSSVEKIGKYAFSGYSSAGKLEFEEPAAGSQDKGINEIYEGAFAYCKKLQGGLYVPHTVVKIESYAFDSFASDSASIGPLHIFGCSGKENSSNEFGYIDKNIFNNSKFNDILISGKVAVIKAEAFKGCTGLTGTLTISGNVEEIQKNAFDTCENLTGLSLDNKHIQKIYEGAFARCKRVEGGLCIPSTVNYMERCAFKQFAELTPDDKIGKLEVYGTSDAIGNLGNPKLNDGDPLFSSAHFKGVIIGGNVKIINHSQFNNRLFYNFGKDLVDTNDNVITSPLGGSDNYDFSGISGDLIIKDGVEKIGSAAFFAMQFDNVTIPKSVNEIHPKAFLFTGTGNGSLTVLGASNGENTHTLGDGKEENPIFLGSKFNGVTIGGSVEHIGAHLFHNKDTFDYYLCEEEIKGEKVNVKYNYTYSNITGNLTIKNTVLTIGESAFESCVFNGRLLLGEAILPDNPEWDTDPEHRSVQLTTIGEYAFKNCNNFTGDLVIPYTMQSMGLNAFYRFAANSSKPGQLLIWGGSSGEGSTIDTEIFVGSQFHGVYIGGCVHTIADQAFINVRYDNDTSRLYNLSGSLVLSPSVKSIGKEAFKGCTFDGELILRDDPYSQSQPEELKIGANAFAGCSNFYKNYTTSDGSQAVFTIPETVTSIGNEAFKLFASANAPGGGPSLIIHGGSDGTTLKKDIFQYSRFHNVTIGGNVKTIDAEAFKSDYNVYDGLTGDLTIEKDTVEIIKSGAFKNAAGFNGKLELGSVKTIEDNAFYNCVNFSGGLNIPYGMNGIGTDAFYRFASETNNPGRFELWSGTRVENGWQYLSGQPFRGAKFKDMLVHGSVNVIDNDAFNSYNITDGDDFRNFTGSLIFTSETEIGSWAFCCDTGFDGELLFKTDSNGKGVSKIGEGAFSGCTNFYTNYKTSDGSQAVFTIPETVTEIKENAFDSMCSGITEFDKIPKLEILGASLTVADSNGNIEKAFGSTGTWNSSTQKYETINIFKNAKFNNVYIGGQVQSIAERAFDNSGGDYNGITGDIEINVKNIWEKAFYKMESVDENYRGKLKLDEGVEQIGPYAFAETRFFGSVTGERSFVIPGSVKSIGNCAFQYFCSGFANPPSLTVKGYASANVENKGNGYKKSDNKNYCDIFEYSCFNNVTFEGNVKVIGTGAFNNSGGQYNGWTGTYTFYAGGLVRLYDGCFVGHNFSNVNLAKSIKHGNVDIISWAKWDKSDVFGKSDNVSTFE